MTDKQIIINGVDVCGCIYYADGKCTNSQMIQSNCKNVAVCYYKEYKAKEQECEELKEKVKKYGEINEQETKDYAELKAENEELKKYKDVVDKLAGMQVILTNEEKMPMLYENAKDLKLKQLSKTLIDIKEIAKKTLNMVDYKTYFKRDNKSLKQEGFKALNEILQKISEVEK